jgi:hypothetical protein
MYVANYKNNIVKMTPLYIQVQFLRHEAIPLSLFNSIGNQALVKTEVVDKDLI